jgi:collagenase-like PrtC family protease
MVQEMCDDERNPDPEAARVIAKARRLMMIASLATLIAIAAVIGIIGYRVFKNEGRVAHPPDVSTATKNWSQRTDLFQHR